MTRLALLEEVARPLPMSMNGQRPPPTATPAAAIDTAALLAEVRGFVTRYVRFGGAQYADAVALWVLHTHAITGAETSPRVVAKSAEKESGKTRLLEVLEQLTANSLFVMNTTPAAVFRLLAEEPTTLLVDEVDAIFGPKAREHEDLRALLNSGYRRGATVARVVGEGTKMRVQRFPVFAATALAAIGDLPDTIESRAIVIPMSRRAPDEHVDSFRRRKVEVTARPLRERLAAWADCYVDGLAEAEPDMPDGLTDRAADCWEPLLAIADLAGGEWPERARQAAQAIVAGRVADDQSTGVRLLADIRSVLNGHDRMGSGDLAKVLNSLEESEWGGWRGGQGLDQRALAKRLKPYGIVSRTIRAADGSTPRGYLRSQFLDAWTRYLRHSEAPVSESPLVSETSATSATEAAVEYGDPLHTVADVALADPNQAVFELTQGVITEECPICGPTDYEPLGNGRRRCLGCQEVWT